MGRNAVLTPEQETNLVERVIYFAERCLPLTPLGLRRCVYQYCKLHSIPHPFSKTKKCADMFCYKYGIIFCFWYLNMNSFCRSEMVQTLYEASTTVEEMKIADDESCSCPET